MSAKAMRALRERVDGQHQDLLQCESVLDYRVWLARYRPDLLAQFPQRVRDEAYAALSAEGQRPTAEPDLRDAPRRGIIATAVRRTFKGARFG